jgi:hypothetical protein
MMIRLTKPIIAAATAVSIFLLIAGSQAQIAASSAEIKVTVTDSTGARIPGSDVVFKSDSKTIVSHFGSELAAIVTLPSGLYSVTVSARGFLKYNVSDFNVVAPLPGELRILLSVDPDFCKNNACICSPCVGAPDTPTIISELPNVIEDDPSPFSPVQPVTKTRKSRSLRCLYLWKCSTT